MWRRLATHYRRSKRYSRWTRPRWSRARRWLWTRAARLCAQHA